MWRTLLPVIAVVTIAAAAPQIVLPFNSQVPPVARVSQPYNFTFAITTFKSSGAGLQYSINSGPAWLQFDAPALTLWGTPGTADAVTTSFNIIASDSSGSTSMHCTLVVTTNPAPTSSQDISAALNQAGNVTGPSRLLAHPRQKFRIGFSTNSYNSHGKDLSFYSTMTDHTPIPPWMTFDARTLQYTGTSPSISSSPQTFDVLLIASDVQDFAGAWNTFTIVVTDDLWAFQPEKQTINIAAGSSVELDNLQSTLFHNGNPASQSDLQRATAQIPSWLQFDNQTLKISGMPPSGVKTTDIKITAYDQSDDPAILELHLRFNSLLKKSVGPLKARAGEAFEYTVDRSDLVDTDISVSFDTGAANSWLHFDAGQLRLSGKVPNDQPSETINLKMTLKTSNQSETDTSDVKLYVQSTAARTDGQTTVSSTTQTSATSSSQSSATGNATAGAIDSVSSKAKGSIAAVVVCPIVGVVAIILILLYCCRPKRRNGRDSKSPSKSDISKPMIVPHDDDYDPDLEKGGFFEPVAAEQPPQLDVKLSPVKDSHTPALSVLQTPKRMTQRVSDVQHSPGSSNVILEDGEAEALDGFNRSSWGYRPHRTPSARPHDSMKVPTAMAHRSRYLSTRRSALRSSAMSQQNQRQSRGYLRLLGKGHGRSSANCSSTGSSDCLNGVGHGRVSAHFCPYCPSPHRESTAPLQTHEEIAESSYGTEATSQLSSAQSPWPTATMWQSNSASKMPKLSRLAATIRSAKAEKSGTESEVSDLPSVLPDRRSLNERRQSYIRNRALMRSPFFGSSNEGSHSRKASSAESAHLSGHGTKTSQASLRRPGAKRMLARELSASSSLEPDLARGRKRSKSRWKLPEGFPRTLSKARSSVASGLRFEDASEAEWERCSVSIYSDDAVGPDTQVGASRSQRSSLSPVHPAMRDISYHEQPATDPPIGPLPTPPFPDPPPKSPRRSTPRPKSGLEDYPPDELPTIEKPKLAVAVRKARLSQISQANKRRIDNLGSKRKEYPDLKRSSIIERPRSSYRPALIAKRGSINRLISMQGNGKSQPSKSGGIADEAAWEDVTGNEAFL